MGVSTEEKGVLKLVHPGRHVEMHREPITAGEIMSKYPRHCIVRPDVLKFPCIVVRPEFLLLPGKVFYLVPNRTLLILLKARRQRSKPFLQENQYQHIHVHHGYRSQNSPRKCREALTTKQGHLRRLPTMLHDRTNSPDQDSEDYCNDTTYVDTQVEFTDKIRTAPCRTYHPSPADSSIDNCRPFNSHESHYHGRNVTSTLSILRRVHNATSALPTFMNGGVRTRSLADHAKLKSCFRKQSSKRKFLNLKVTFASLITIPGSPVGSSSPKQIVWACNRYNSRL